MFSAVWILAAVPLAGQLATLSRPEDGPRLAALVGAIRAADYRGERADLRRLAGALEAVKDPSLGAVRCYWQGFGQWRRAINGFNETPVPQDLKDDLES
ncbi:MAG: hypothetical protein ACHQNV_05695, partial [Vicinamibacteria bacterium]